MPVCLTATAESAARRRARSQGAVKTASQRLATAAGLRLDGFARSLTSSFIVRRVIDASTAGVASMSIIAGYPGSPIGVATP